MRGLERGGAPGRQGEAKRIGGYRAQGHERGTEEDVAD